MRRANANIDDMSGPDRAPNVFTKAPPEGHPGALTALLPPCLRIRSTEHAIFDLAAGSRLRGGITILGWYMIVNM